jgi:hypothetical protein
MTRRGRAGLSRVKTALIMRALRRNMATFSGTPPSSATRRSASKLPRWALTTRVPRPAVVSRSRCSRPCTIVAKSPVSPTRKDTRSMMFSANW